MRRRISRGGIHQWPVNVPHKGPFNLESLSISWSLPTNSNPALVYIVAWRRIGDKPLSELMLTRFTNSYADELEIASYTMAPCHVGLWCVLCLDILLNQWWSCRWFGTPLRSGGILYCSQRYIASYLLCVRDDCFGSQLRTDTVTQSQAAICPTSPTQDVSINCPSNHMALATAHLKWKLHMIII